jgi:hypothetical protein
MVNTPGLKIPGATVLQAIRKVAPVRLPGIP